MLTLSPASSAVEAARTITEALPFKPSPSALKLYRVLVEAALTIAAAKGYAPTTTEVVFFAPAEAVAVDAGLHPSTVYRALAELKAEGVIDARGHFCTYRGRTKADGTIWAVRISPRRGARARVGYADLKRSYRDLGADITAGKTAWAALRESRATSRAEGLGARLTLTWALAPTHRAPVTHDSRGGVKRGLERLLDVIYAPKHERAEAVDAAARAVAAALGDQKGLNFYRLIVWNALRLHDRDQGGDVWFWLYEQVGRAAVDAQEGFARRAGALFTSRLIAAPWYEGLRRTPPVRVGSRPLTA